MACQTMTQDDQTFENSARHECLASTGDHYKTCTLDNGAQGATRIESNCFQRCSLSPDGSTVVTYNQDRITRSFLVDRSDDVNQQHNESPVSWRPYSESRAVQTSASAIYPWYHVDNASSTVVLQAHNGLPIRLINALDLSHTHASYPWVNETTEAWITPVSLAFSRSGTHYIAGAKERLAIFDLVRDGEDPILDSRTRANPRTRKQYGEATTPLSGLVAALAVGPDGTLAAGTTDRQIGLWDSDGSGSQISTFSIATNNKLDPLCKDGSGITQLKWSSCGQYLFVAERSSDSLLLYDMRMGRRLSRLIGRKALTMQRMSFDIDQVSSRQGTDIWAGGCDGVVRTWTDVTAVEGEQLPARSFKAHDDVVSSTIVHEASQRLITTSGQRFHPQRLYDTGESDQIDGDQILDNSLRLWTL